MAKAYISHSLIDESVDDDRDLLFPFTDNALKEAIRRTLGVPGKYLTFLHSAIEKGIDQGWDVIDESKLTEVELPNVSKNDEENESDENTPLPESKTKI